MAFGTAGLGSFCARSENSTKWGQCHFLTPSFELSRPKSEAPNVHLEVEEQLAGGREAPPRYLVFPVSWWWVMVELVGSVVTRPVI